MWLERLCFAVYAVLFVGIFLCPWVSERESRFYRLLGVAVLLCGLTGAYFWMDSLANGRGLFRVGEFQPGDLILHPGGYGPEMATASGEISTLSLFGLLPLHGQSEWVVKIPPDNLVLLTDKNQPGSRPICLIVDVHWPNLMSRLKLWV